MSSKKLFDALKKTTSDWTKQRKREEREAIQRHNRRINLTKSSRVTVKEAAWEIMESAYLKASANNTLPAHARQIMYAARGYIQERTGRKLDDQYFTQTLLPDYLSEHPDKELEWDVVFDARGHFSEPHTNRVINLGTLDVRRYLSRISTNDPSENVALSIGGDYRTIGPEHRFSAILFVEKEGFFPLFEKVQLAEKYDIAIMSTKGMSVTAARLLVDDLCHEHNIPLLILRDFDKAGFSIAGTLQRDTRRYEFKNSIEVIDLGLRLEDVMEWHLTDMAEDVSYGRTNPKVNLYENGATDEEVDFLVTGSQSQFSFSLGPRMSDRVYFGRRVELNAFSSDKLIDWIERKLEEHAVEKVTPSEEIMESFYRKCLLNARLERYLMEQRLSLWEKIKDMEIKDIQDRVMEYLMDNPEAPWDQAVVDLATEDLEASKDVDNGLG